MQIGTKNNLFDNFNWKKCSSYCCENKNIPTGELVGVEVGLVVGSMVGVSVGLIVGLGVGWEVGEMVSQKKTKNKKQISFKISMLEENYRIKVYLAHKAWDLSEHALFNFEVQCAFV